MNFTQYANSPNSRTHSRLVARVAALVVAIALVATTLFALNGSVATAQSSGCLVVDLGVLRLEDTKTRNGTWQPGDCTSAHRANSWSDTYRFEMEYQADVLLEVTSQDANPYIYLIGGDHSVLTENDDVVPEIDRDSRIEANLTAGTYWVRTTTYAARDAGSYTITVRVTSGEVNRDDEDGYGMMEAEGAAGPSTCRIEQLGNITKRNDNSGELQISDCNSHQPNESRFDTWQFGVSNRTFVAISVTKALGVNLRLLDESGAILQSVVAPRELKTKATIRFTINAGTYRIEVGSISAFFGRYDLSIAPVGLQKFAERYAPVLKFERNESFLPVGVEAMLEHSKLMYRRTSIAGIDSTVSDDELSAHPTTALLGDFSNTGERHYLEIRDVGQSSTKAKRWWNQQRQNYGNVVYAHVTNISGFTVIQYWLFYVFNDAQVRGDFAFADHQGDWEGIQLVFAQSIDELWEGRTTRPLWVAYASHEGGAFSLEPSSDLVGAKLATGVGMTCFFANSTNHPVVYIARGSHAAYHAAGVYARKLSLGLTSIKHSTDYAQGNGTTLLPRSTPAISDDRGRYEVRLLVGDEGWLAWAGRWGDDDGGGIDTHDRGPQGPAHKGIWDTLAMFVDDWSFASSRCRS